MVDPNRNRMFAGAVLIIIGLGLLALQMTQGFGQSLTIFIVGGLFIAGYFYRQAYGLLIPGCILIGLGLGSIGQNNLVSFGNFSSIGLGIGFLAIYAIDRVYRGASPWWPLIPGAILVIVGLAEGNTNLARLISIGWPLVLVLIGVLLVAGAMGLTRRPHP